MPPRRKRISVVAPLAASLLALAGAAHAQVGPPAVLTLTGPLTLRARLENGREHGCSLSHESVSVEADLELLVDAAGRASLHLVGAVLRVSGPSRGAWRAGDHDVSSMTELDEVRWTGAGRLDASGAGLDLDFVNREGSTLRIDGFGRAPLPPPVRSTRAVAASCRGVDRDVLPAVRSDGETATSMALVECGFPAGLPDPLERYLDAGASVVFGAGAGIRTITDQMAWAGTTTELRRVD